MLSLEFSSTVTTTCAIATLIGLIGFAIFAKNRSRLPHPPGPKGYPFLGCLGIPAGEAWKEYRRLSDLYGSDVIRVNMLGTNFVITNSLEASTDLLEQRSSIYSDRPTSGLTMLIELCGFDWSVALMRYGSVWRDSRKAFQREFHPQAIHRFRSIETKATYEFARNLLDSPNKFMDHIRRVTGRQLIYSAYGIDVRENGDHIIQTAEHGLEAAVAAMSPGQFWVDILPFLKYVPAWFPGATFKKKAKIWRASVDQMLHVPFDLAKEKLATHTLPEDCAAKELLTDLIPNASDPAYMEHVVRATLGTMYGAGTDTTVSTLQSFFLAMVLYPDVQKKAQKDIDRTCHGRLPEFSDYDSLPYVHAILKETLRWMPVIPLNVAHSSTKDDIYKGYFIPTGSVVLANTWAILHDPEAYPDPHTFNPLRFVRQNARGELELDPRVRDPDVAAFGMGRRICPGRFMAYESLWMAMATVLAAFDISKAKDADGKDVTPVAECVPGFMCFPKPFECTIKPRSADYASLIEATVAQES